MTRMLCALVGSLMLAMLPVPSLAVPSLQPLVVGSVADPEALWDQSDWSETTAYAHGGGSYFYDEFPASIVNLEDRVANHVSFSRPVVITEIASYMKFLLFTPGQPVGQVSQTSPVGEGPFAAELVLRPATTGDPNSLILRRTSP